MKCRTLTYIYYIRSIFVSHQSIIPRFSPQMIFKILSKITGPRNISHWPTYNNEVNLCVALIHYPIYDIHPSNTLEDIRQNHWTMKYIFYEVNLCTILIHYPKYNITTSNSLQDTCIKLNHWTAKNRSRTDQHIFHEVYHCVTLMRYPKYDVYPSNNLEDRGYCDSKHSWKLTSIL